MSQTAPATQPPGTNPLTPGPAGWLLNAESDYAHPAVKGGGYVEVQDDGTFEVAFEAGDLMQERAGCDAYLITKIPVDVLRALVAAYDAKAAAK